ncbi:hypothetical protein [Mycolicibacterium peregrinum]|uniref:hypothetical protein n=1 Tax=Mycolicibacterium peregrinum TaxID=43304 RepID=UPI003AAD35CC
MKERLRSPPERPDQRSLGRLGVFAALGESLGIMKFYAPVQEDLDRKPGEPTRAERLKSDVIVVRAGVKPLGKKKIHLAGNAIRAAK